MDICEFTNIMLPDTNKEIGPTIEALYLSHHSQPFQSNQTRVRSILLVSCASGISVHVLRNHGYFPSAPSKPKQKELPFVHL